MELNVRGHGLQIDTELREAADQHWRKIEHLLTVGRVVEAKLELRHHTPRTGGDYTVAQLTVQTGRRIIRSEEQARNATAAIDRAFQRFEAQIRRAHDRRATRKLAQADKVAAIPASTDETDLEIGDGADDGRIIRTKRFQVKPMDIDEAIEQLELLGHDFFLFDNADGTGLNVVYRRRDGAYGLLAPSV